MLEIERQNREPVDASAGSNGPDGPAGAAEAGSAQVGPVQGGGGLLRRARRAVTRPAGPPTAEPSGAPEVPSGAPAEPSGAPTVPSAVAEPPAAKEPRATTRAAKGEPRAAGATAVVPETSDTRASEPAAGDPAAGEQQAAPARRRSSRTRAAGARGTDAAGGPAASSTGGTSGARREQDAPATGEAGQGSGGPVATVPFQPPLVIFQAPDVTPAPAAPRPQRQQQPGQAAGDEAAEDEGTAPGGRRRRRGGRGRSKAREGAAEGTDQPAAPAAERESAAPEAADEEADGAEATAGTAKRRRRRRRTSGSDAEGAAAASADDPPNTVVHVRAPRDKTAEVADVRAVKGSTRLEAKRQRRREGRESGRRRPPIITESEFLARREAVERSMVVRQRADRTQIAVLEDGVLVEHYVDKASHQSYVGNVYLGKVQNVLPSMEAAFVDIGKGRNAVLYAGEVNFDASGLEGESKRIESALKSGQQILVQVTKDPIGHKGARLTSQVSLPGRYLVYVPGASMTGISRKLPDTERSRLKQILRDVMPENAGVIVRTAAEGASADELSRDVTRLAAQWEAIEKKAKTASAPELLYSEPDLTLRVVRDIFNEDFTNLIIAGDGEWDLVDEYVRYVAPHLAERLRRWEDDGDVFATYRIDEQIGKALERKVWLPSGGSLVIDNTEAMTVIDVNTGKFTGQGGNLEQTVTRNNLEAAEEIVRQLRLRDVGGIIVIDFIDMVLESNRELVLRRLLECLARDRTKHQVAEVTSLGLVQMTRKRVGSGLLEAFSVPCEQCNGRGVIISLEPVDHAHGRDTGRGGGQRPPKPAPPKPASDSQAQANGIGQGEVSGPARAVTVDGELEEPAGFNGQQPLEPASTDGADGPEQGGDAPVRAGRSGRSRSGRSRRPAARANAGDQAEGGDAAPGNTGGDGTVPDAGA
jgi:ribonuclease E